jgi:hypothetical protein
MLRHAREVGGPALRKLTFHQRGCSRRSGSRSWRGRKSCTSSTF